MEDLHDKKKREIQDVKPIGPSSLLGKSYYLMERQELTQKVSRPHCSS